METTSRENQIRWKWGTPERVKSTNRGMTMRHHPNARQEKKAGRPQTAESNGDSKGEKA